MRREDLKNPAKSVNRTVKTFNEWMEDKRDVWSVTREAKGQERGDGFRTEVLFDGLLSEKEAWNAGHDWLMENDRPYEALDIRKNGEVVGAVSWEP